MIKEFDALDYWSKKARELSKENCELRLELLKYNVLDTEKNRTRLDNLLWVPLEEHKTIVKELEKYKVFYDHIASHKEVQTAPYKPGQVMCKICNKTFNEVLGGSDDKKD